MEWSICKEEPTETKKSFCFSVSSRARIYLISAESSEARRLWIAALKRAIDEKKGIPAGGSVTPSPQPTPQSDFKQQEKPAQTAGRDSNGGSSTPTPKPAETKATAQAGAGGKGGNSPRHQLSNAKKAIPFLQDDESKVREFWDIWYNSIPTKDELVVGTPFGIDFNVSTSAGMQKLTWRTGGPQNIFIQRMVDFFWNVGAPESEIDKLNDIGAMINPVKIGSWIDMSSEGGMDGGWYFPVDITLKTAIDAADAGDSLKKVQEWADKHNIEKLISVGRDMGAAPPRQTEFRIKLPTSSFEAQLKIAMDAYEIFGFPPPPEPAMALLQSSDKEGLILSVITSSEGFVRIGLLTPKPSTDVVLKLCSVVKANDHDLAVFENYLGINGPSYVEYQYLNTNFGYSVYKEGFDIIFHYHVGDEVPPTQ